MFVLIDHLSKFGWAFLVTDKKAETIIECFKTVFASTENIPGEIQFDNGKEFANKDMTEYFNSLPSWK